MQKRHKKNKSSKKSIKHKCDKSNFLTEPFRWQAIKSGVEPRDLGVESPIISLYMEDKNGRLIPKSTKKALCRDLYGYWNDLYSFGSDNLCPYGELGLDRKDLFWNHFEGSYPWLRLCASHWKVDQLWLSYSHTWKKPCTSDCAVKEPSPPSIPSKCRLKEDEDSADDPSRRRKGKAVDIMAPTVFHHSCPLT